MGYRPPILEKDNFLEAVNLIWAYLGQAAFNAAIFVIERF
jgi:hypothetical protein